MTRLTGLYPRRWRDRYGEELAELLELRPVTWSARLDLVRGVLDAHRHPELVDRTVPAPLTAMEPVSPRRLADLRVARRLGIAAIGGTVAWLAAWVVAANGPIVHDVGFSYRDGSAAMPLFLGALWLLAAGLVGQIIRLPSRAIVARLAAFVATVAFGLYAFGPWNLPFGVIGLLGICTFAGAAWWAGHWSGANASIVTSASVIGAWSMWLTMSGSGVPGIEPVPSMVAAMALFGSLWVVVGASLLRLPPVDDALVEDATGGVPGVVTPA